MKTLRIIRATIIATGLLFGVISVSRTQTISGNDANGSGLSINKSAYYRTAIGLRAGETSGLTLKRFSGTGRAVEGIIGMWPSGLSLSVLYEAYASAGTTGLSWYYGAGGHAAFETSRLIYTAYDYAGRYYSYRTLGSMGLGVDGIIGLEYKVLPIPFALSFDLKPFLEINTSGRAYMAVDPGLGIKLTF